MRAGRSGRALPGRSVLSSTGGRTTRGRIVMTEPIRFLLNGAPAEVTGLAPQNTLLDYLRESCGLTGTKEGCAEGDCGACTVVLAQRQGDALAWQPINACIRLLPSVDGKAVFTVESLRAADGALHPVQRAMVEAHASQCGFCTPGFVMSLYAHQREGGACDRQSLKDALAGNLCRCTGYGPILAAGEAMGADPDAAERPALAQALAAIQPVEALVIEHKGRRFLAPRSLAEFAGAVAEAPDAVILAGGTDVGLW